MKITLKNTIYAGYAVMLFFIFFISGATIKNLNNLSSVFDSIVSSDMPIAEDIRKLSDSLMAQDIYEKRFLILKDSDVENLYWIRSGEFNGLLNNIDTRSSDYKDDLKLLNQLHKEYNALFGEEVSAIERNHFDKAKQISSRMKNHYNKISTLLRELKVKIIKHKDDKINASNKLVEETLFTTIVISVLSSIFALTFAFVFASYIIRSIEKLKDATTFIKSGDFDKIPQIGGINEFSELSVSFKEMTNRLKELEAMNLDANPLTKLPGNLAIEKELLIRFKKGLIFSFCLIDIDNFKAYSDKYGYVKGSEALEWLGKSIQKLVKQHGNETDFIGHIGGDDFVLISEPSRVKTLSQHLIDLFDNSISNFYNNEDRENGFIISVNRQNQVMKFPIMTISISIVSNDKIRINDPKEVAERIADLKKYAKSFPKSIYVCERRRGQ